MLAIVGRQPSWAHPLSAFWLMFRSFWGQISCSFYPAGFYAFYTAFTVLALAGLVWGWRRLERSERVSTAILVGWFLLIVISWARWDALTPAPGGRLLFPALLALGRRRRSHLRRWPPSGPCRFRRPTRTPPALAAEYPDRLHVLHRPGKLGLGTAHIAGFRHALATGADLVLTIDADFSHHPRYIPAILDRVADGYDGVIGARYIAGGGTPGWTWPRRLLSWGANTFARTMLGLHIHDTTGAFRCYRCQVLESMDLEAIRSSGYSFLIEMAYGIQRAGWRIGEVPIIFEDRRLGQSKISRHEITRALWTVLRLAWGRLRG